MDVSFSIASQSGTFDLSLFVVALHVQLYVLAGP
jgi:hypothetical protein